VIVPPFASLWDRGFESCFRQRRVRNELYSYQAPPCRRADAIVVLRQPIDRLAHVALPLGCCVSTHLLLPEELEWRGDPRPRRRDDGDRRGLLGDPGDAHSRYIEVAVGSSMVGCLYLPNGNPAPGPKFDYKLRWFERLRRKREQRTWLEVRILEPAAKAGDLEAFRKSVEDRGEFAADSPLEEDGFEPPVPP
jgi:hypothetical protein